ncbi:MAG TPA: glycerophosphodiester phosphodiesterase family protein [Phycisphaerae bacterium]|nr:glycerophosphodiester phosphodiesterase family protein [Phycisphaerae bacterium]
MAQPGVIAIAHRGASAAAPENTVAAFDEAIRLGAWAVEFDVRLSADGVPVVIHDETVNRTTNGQGAVNALTRLDMLRLDAGSWKHPRFSGVRIPTLHEALQAIEGRAIPAVELKVPIDPELLRSALELNDALDKAVILSFDPGVVATVRGGMPGVMLGFSSETWRADLPEQCRRLGAQILVLDVAAVSLNNVSAAHREGREVWCYTVNDPGAVAACSAMGVRGIITDQPDLIRQRRRMEK